MPLLNLSSWVPGLSRVAGWFRGPASPPEEPDHEPIDPPTGSENGPAPQITITREKDDGTVASVGYEDQLDLLHPGNHPGAGSIRSFGDDSGYGDEIHPTDDEEPKDQETNVSPRMICDRDRNSTHELAPVPRQIDDPRPESPDCDMANDHRPEIQYPNQPVPPQIRTPAEERPRVFDAPFRGYTPDQRSCNYYQPSQERTNMNHTRRYDSDSRDRINSNKHRPNKHPAKDPREILSRVKPKRRLRLAFRSWVFGQAKTSKELERSCKDGDVQLTADLLKNMPRTYKRCPEFFEGPVFACIKGITRHPTRSTTLPARCTECLEVLVIAMKEMDVDIDKIGHSKRERPLMKLVKYSDSTVSGQDRLRAMEILLKGEAGVDVDKKDRHGSTALHRAVELDNADMVKLLLKYRAN